MFPAAQGAREITDSCILFFFNMKFVKLPLILSPTMHILVCINEHT